MAIPLIKGEPVGTPPAGSQMFASDASGQAYLLNSDGTRSPIGSTAATDWLGQQLAHAQSLDPTLALVAWSVTGFNTGDNGTPPKALGLWFAAGSGISILTEEGPPIRVATTAANGTTGFLQSAQNSINMVSNLKTKGWYLVFRGRPNAADAQALQEVEMSGSTQEVAMAVDGSIDATKWSIVTRGGATSSVQGSAADTAAYHDMALWNNPLVALTMYKDRVQDAQMTDLTNVTTQAGFPIVFVKNGTTATVRQVDIAAIALFTRLPA